MGSKAGGILRRLASKTRLLAAGLSVVHTQRDACFETARSAWGEHSSMSSSQYRRLAENHWLIGVQGSAPLLSKGARKKP